MGPAELRLRGFSQAGGFKEGMKGISPFWNTDKTNSDSSFRSDCGLHQLLRNETFTC